ncbi:Hypothetical predicted protein [Pelobates cultripes]|uniref:Uncharacterized protein n=1 Tax=Pelobates cultripes TaxID=61616 RepID=A0AAD1R519_PELCU|nr:Hypothetical predicted protein [Pelobates cultripes]
MMPITKSLTAWLRVQAPGGRNRQIPVLCHILQQDLTEPPTTPVGQGDIPVHTTVPAERINPGKPRIGTMECNPTHKMADALPGLS